MTIVRKKKQGKADLEGNQARAFLKCLDRLEECLMRESPSVVVQGLGYIAVLRCFDTVVHQCFGVTLDAANYKDSINRFSQLYRDIGISVTPKVSFYLLLPYLRS